jgi:hypothetical protein
MDLKSAFLHKIPNRFQIIDIWIPLGYVNLSSAVKMKDEVTLENGSIWTLTGTNLKNGTLKGGMTYEKDYNN